MEGPNNVAANVDEDAGPHLPPRGWEDFIHNLQHGIEEGDVPTVADWIEWIDASRAYLSRYLERVRTMSEDAEYGVNLFITPCAFLCLASDVEVRDLFLTATHEVHLGNLPGQLQVELNGLVESIISLRQLGWHMIDGFEPAVATLAAFLGSFKSIGRIDMVGCNILSLSIFAPILAACTRVGFLFLEDFERIEDGEATEAINEIRRSYIRSLRDAIGAQTLLKGLYIDHIEMSTLRILCPAIVTNSTLLSWSISGTQSFPCTISSTEDADAIRQLISMPSLEYLSLAWINFANEQVTTSVCETIADKHMDHVVSECWSYPPSMDSVVAQALASPNHKKLSYSSPRRAASLEAVGVALTTSSSEFDGLYFLFHHFAADDDVLARMLLAASSWKVAEVELICIHWTEAFDKAISTFVEKSKSLSSLRIVVSWDIHTDDPYVLPPTASKRFEQTTSLGGGKLESIRIDADYDYEGDAPLVNTTWAEKVVHNVAVNKLRLAYAPKFHGTTADQKLKELIQLILDLDLQMVYEFLRQNTFDMQALLLEQHDG
jgi:hypothetical protein